MRMINNMMNENENGMPLTVKEYRKHSAWSAYLKKHFGPWAALSFAFGSNVLLENIQADLEALKSLPAGTLLDDTNSIVFATLPQQFADQYDAAFLTRMETELLLFRERARSGDSMVAYSVMEELLLYLCVGETICYLETTGETVVYGGKKITPSYDWLADLFDDMDIVMCLYSDITLPENHLYHLCHWDDKVFYTKEVCL